MNRFGRFLYPVTVDPTVEPRVTPRQREVWRRIASGESAKQIAARMGISVGTVNDHREALFARLGVKNAIPATRLAIRWGVVSEPVMAIAY